MLRIDLHVLFTTLFSIARTVDCWPYLLIIVNCPIYNRLSELHTIPINFTLATGEFIVISE